MTSVHGTKWMQELTTMAKSAGEKLASGNKELIRPDTPGGNVAKPKLHEGDLYLCRESLDAFQGALGGVVDAVDAVFGSRPSSSRSNTGPTSTANVTKRAFVCVRPPGHHCSADMPSGFCWLNNVHVGIEHAAQAYNMTHAAIIDFDLHHGDGSQAITWERNARAAKAPKAATQSKKTNIGYFSIHDVNSYPCEYGDPGKVQAASLCLENAHNQTVWNVHLQPWSREPEFWQLYESRYQLLLDKARTYLRTQTARLKAAAPNVQPKAAIFISAGFDASEHEGEGMQRHKVTVPTEFYARFTSDILKIADEEGTSVEGRVISVLEGGYSDRALTSGVLSHISGLAAAAPDIDGDTDASAKASKGYHKSWWHIQALHELEGLIHPTGPHVSKNTRTSELSTFASPTQSFTAKVVDPSKVYRSLSGAAPVPETSRPPTPPPPQVDWATAAHELSKLLIPNDRQINSCRFEELNEPKPKRHSTIGLAKDSAAEKMQTRGRKTRVPGYPTPSATNGLELPLRKDSSSSRRRTISDLPNTAEGVTPSIERLDSLESKAAPKTSTHVIGFTANGQGSRYASPTKAGKEAAKTHRTRRASGAITDLQPKDPNAGAPSVPKVPSKYGPPKPAVPRVKRESTVDTTRSATSGTSDAMDKITSGVKKITLKMPQKASSMEADADPTASTAASRTVRKPSVPRTSSVKTAAAKPVAPKPSKASKAAAATLSKPQDYSNTDQVMESDPTQPPERATPALQVIPDSQASDGIDLEPPANPKPSHPVPSPPTSNISEPSTTSFVIPPSPANLDSAPHADPGTWAQPATSHPSQTTTTDALAPSTIDALQPTADMLPPTEAESRLGSKPSVTAPYQSAEETISALQRQAIASTGANPEFIAYQPSADFQTASSALFDGMSNSVGDGNGVAKPGNDKPELTWLPPNTNTPTETPVKKSKDGAETRKVKEVKWPVKGPKESKPLPRFSATGNIPFASSEWGQGIKEQQRKGKAQGAEADDGRKQSAWDVPNTPRG